MSTMNATALEAVTDNIVGHLARIDRMNRWFYCFGDEQRRVRTVREIAATVVHEVWGNQLADHTADQVLEIGVLILTAAAQIDSDQPRRVFT